jgi:hypothetical protein
VEDRVHTAQRPIARVTQDIGVAEESRRGADDHGQTARTRFAQSISPADDGALSATGVASIEERSHVIWTILAFRGIDAAIRAALDGYGAGPKQDIDDPLGVGGRSCTPLMQPTNAGRRSARVPACQRRQGTVGCHRVVCS